MRTETEIMNILDLPDNLNNLIASICDHLSHFSVAVLRIFTDDTMEQIKLIGSGTLVTVNNCPAILTAEHVLKGLKKSDQLGLLTSFKGNPHRYTFSQNKFSINHIILHKIARGDDDSKGPDLGLIMLPESNIGRLKAEKSFFNIDKQQKRFSKGFIKSNRGFWFTVGFPGEFERDMKSNRGYAAIKGYQGLCGISDISKEYEDQGYDYIEMEIEYDSFNIDLPKNFGGMSGSGVWHVPLIKNSEGNIEADEYILSGVVFYQTELEANHCLIRCHGRKTIYVKMPEYLNSILGS